MASSMAVHSFILLLLFLTMHQSQSTPSLSNYPTPFTSVRAAYWPSGSDFPTSSIDTNYFTHIYYAFLNPDPVDSFKLSITQSNQTELRNFISGLRNRHPPVKTLLSIGGGGSNSFAFAAMASTPHSRSAFIDSTIQVACQYGFDGLDLDWEFPDTPRDMSAFPSDTGGTG